MQHAQVHGRTGAPAQQLTRLSVACLAHSARLAVLAAFVLTHGALAQNSGAQGDGEWRVHHRDHAGTHYSPLGQIDRSNVNRLRVAWRWLPDSLERPIDVRN
ncbi:MAG: hypothetical protein ACT4P7_19320, partial [Gemmatimonadaceae bacterium]